MEIHLKRESADVKVPTRGSSKAAGYDLYAYIQNENGYHVIMPHETEKIHTGLSFQPPEGYFGAIFARSGLATHYGVRPANCCGICDQDYTGEYIVALHNDSCDPVIIKNGDRIAQLIFLPYQDIDFIEVDEIKQTDRGDDGFGSTGK